MVLPTWAASIERMSENSNSPVLKGLGKDMSEVGGEWNRLPKRRSKLNNGKISLT